MHSRFSTLSFACALLVGAGLVLSMSACDAVGSFADDDEDAPDVEIGRFEMTLSGALDETLTGTAVFSTTTEERPDTGEEVTLFGLAFIPDSANVDDVENEQASWFAAQIMRASERPDEGEYEFAQIDENNFPDDPFDFPDELFAFSFQTEDTERYAVVASQEGTLEITSSSSATLSGRFSVETAGMHYTYDTMDEPAEGSITIEGEFKALGGELPENL